MKVALVTGGSNGIGKSAAIELGRRGVGVIFTYHANERGVADIVAEIERSGARAIGLKLDLSRKASFAEFARLVRSKLEEIWQRATFDYLVNNGGVGGGMLFSEVTEEYFDRIFATNFQGPFFLTQHLLPLLADGGRIVNTSSSASRTAPPGYSVYGPFKAALSSWTRYLAKELAPRQIRVNAVSPGPVVTNLGDGAFDKHPEYIQPLSDQTALGRIGAPQDIGNVIVNLLSDDCAWITAQDIEVSGGFML